MTSLEKIAEQARPDPTMVFSSLSSSPSQSPNDGFRTPSPESPRRAPVAVASSAEGAVRSSSRSESRGKGGGGGSSRLSWRSLSPIRGSRSSTWRYTHDDDGGGGDGDRSGRQEEKKIVVYKSSAPLSQRASDKLRAEQRLAAVLALIPTRLAASGSLSRGSLHMAQGVRGSSQDAAVLWEVRLPSPPSDAPRVKSSLPSPAISGASNGVYGSTHKVAVFSGSETPRVSSSPSLAALRDSFPFTFRPPFLLFSPRPPLRNFSPPLSPPNPLRHFSPFRSSSNSSFRVPPLRYPPQRFGGRPDSALCAVFDGHGPFGRVVSSYAAATLPPLLLDSHLLARAAAADAAAGTADAPGGSPAGGSGGGAVPGAGDRAAWRAKMHDVFASVERDVRVHPHINPLNSGSTAVVAVLQRDVRVHPHINPLNSGSTAVVAVLQVGKGEGVVGGGLEVAERVEGAEVGGGGMGDQEEVALRGAGPSGGVGGGQPLRLAHSPASLVPHSPFFPLSQGRDLVVAWGRDLVVAWVGDSRCVVGLVSPPTPLAGGASAHGGREGHGVDSSGSGACGAGGGGGGGGERGCGDVEVEALQLTTDHKPAHPEERFRIVVAGGRVHAIPGDPEGVERAWLPHEEAPGIAMSRCLGSALMRAHGVTADPDVRFLRLGPQHRFMVLASDGVWDVDVLSNEAVVAIIASSPSPQEAAAAVVWDVLSNEAVVAIVASSPSPQEATHILPQTCLPLTSFPQTSFSPPTGVGRAVQ
ncbi:unnamed protein product [Closterium sp. Naga37s-1]|nr:unnamed protein product [Closterium sp. Naga37s-1]